MHVSSISAWSFFFFSIVMLIPFTIYLCLSRKWTLSRDEHLKMLKINLCLTPWICTLWIYIFFLSCLLKSSLSSFFYFFPGFLPGHYFHSFEAIFYTAVFWLDLFLYKKNSKTFVIIILLHCALLLDIFLLEQRVNGSALRSFCLFVVDGFINLQSMRSERGQL